jgi:hypothetical protein
LCRCDTTVREPALALDLQLGALERCPIALERRLALCQLRAQRPVVESKKEIALLDLLPFLEMNLDNLSVHARLDHDGRDRLDAADPGDLDRRRHGGDIIDHDRLTGRRPRRPGIAPLVEDKAPKIVH